MNTARLLILIINYALAVLIVVTVYSAITEPSLRIASILYLPVLIGIMAITVTKGYKDW